MGYNEVLWGKMERSHISDTLYLMIPECSRKKNKKKYTKGLNGKKYSNVGMKSMK